MKLRDRYKVQNVLLIFIINVKFNKNNCSPKQSDRNQSHTKHLFMKFLLRTMIVKYIPKPSTLPNLVFTYIYAFKYIHLRNLVNLVKNRYPY